VDPVAKTLFEYLRDIIYKPAHAALDVEALPKGFHTLGEGLKYLADCLVETRTLARALSKGDLESFTPSPDNEVAAPLKSLHSSLQHLTWQTQQVAKGDYQQRVDFMGDFSAAFNTMTQQLEERRRKDADEKSTLQQYVRLLLSNAPNLILLFDLEGRIVFTSASYLRGRNMADADLVQHGSFRDVFASVTDDAFLQRMDDVFRAAVLDKRSSELEHDIAFHGDGNARHYRIQLTPMLDEAGVVVGIMLIFHDVTEITKARHTAEHARRQAEQSAAAKSEFLARMSHEMRTPMNAIIGMTTLARAAETPERRTHCLDRISEASQHLLGVISDILDMSTLEEHSISLSLHECNLAEMAQRAAHIMAFRFEERKQSFTLDIDEDIPARVILDEQRLMQVLVNLLSNAEKFTPELGHISLAVKKTTEDDNTCTLRFEVRDTGIGISEEKQQELFDAFSQADGGFSRKVGGVGLGLAISQRIINLMGGHIRVESAIGKGSAFSFEIKARIMPRANPAANIEAAPDLARRQPEGRAEDSAPPVEESTEFFTGERLLIAEDVEINREILASLLEDTGIELHFANNGVEAVAKFSAEPESYGAILMDIHMPDMDGYEATRSIRSSGLPGARKIPIIALTANVFPEDIDRCLACGMNSHLGKPVDFDQLIATLKQHLV
jgi:PAS domain S-box-containing protein